MDITQVGGGIEGALFVIDKSHKLYFTNVLIDIVIAAEAEPDVSEDLVGSIPFTNPVIPSGTDLGLFHVVDEGEGGVIVAAFYLCSIKVLYILAHCREPADLAQVCLHVLSEVKHDVSQSSFVGGLEVPVKEVLPVTEVLDSLDMFGLDDSVGLLE